MAWWQRGEESHHVPRVEGSVKSLKLRASFSPLRGGWGLAGHPMWTELDQFGPLAIVRFSYWQPREMSGDWRPFVSSSTTSYRVHIKNGQDQSLPNIQTFISKQAQVTQSVWGSQGVGLSSSYLSLKRGPRSSFWLTPYFKNRLFCQWKIVSSIPQTHSPCWCSFDGG